MQSKHARWGTENMAVKKHPVHGIEPLKTNRMQMK